MFALLSVSNKEGLVPLAQGLVRLGYRMLSTGGTFEALSKAGIPVVAVAEHTQSPEILQGRVKTLHPKIHGGLLGRVEREDDLTQMRTHGISPIALLAVNLYPFAETVAKGASPEEVLEQIDVGGPAMIRAAAKNARNVIVLTNPADYPRVLKELEENQGKLSDATRACLQRKAFEHTAAYDAAIAGWMQKRAEEDFPETLALSFERVQSLRYGENPHQRAAFYRSKIQPAGPNVAFSRVLQGKELSYNNLLDLDAALSAVLEFPQTPAAVVIKHNTPCGVALGENVQEAFERAKGADEISAFGGIVALNREVDAGCAQSLCSLFLEAVIAPSYSKEALALLASKKNVRLLEAGALLASPEPLPLVQVDCRSISGGLLAMDRDAPKPGADWKVVTRRAPTPEEMAALRFSWKVCKHVKSNAIVYANAFQTLAVGGGQTSRVDSARLAAEKGGAKLKGSAVASDAFFPFRDGIDVVAKAGASCVVQPGGSLKDAEVIAAADEHNLSMVFTGARLFRHRSQVMRIICSQCQTRFRVDDKYMTARGVRVQCPRCAHIELIKPAPVETYTKEHVVSAGSAARGMEQSFASPPAPREVPSVQQDAELDFSALQSELQEEDAKPQNLPMFPRPSSENVEFQTMPSLESLELQTMPSLEGWELQPTQTIIGPSIHCQSCGKVLSDSFDQALEVCESCRNLPLKPKAPISNMNMVQKEVVVVTEPPPYALNEGSFPVSDEMESLATQYTPPYAFESISENSSQAAEVNEELPAKRGVWFWLRWVLIGWGMAVFLVLLFLAFFVR